MLRTYFPHIEKTFPVAGACLFASVHNLPSSLTEKANDAFDDQSP